MKNLFLFLLLSSVLALIYHFEELGDARTEQEELSRKRVFPSLSLEGFQEEDLREIRIGGTFFIKKGKEFFVSGGKAADPQALREILERLGHIHLQRALTEEEKRAARRENFFKNENEYFQFVFKKGKVKYLLGEKLSFDETFYLEITKDENPPVWVVARDESPVDHLFLGPEANPPDKYLEIKSYLSLPESFFTKNERKEILGN